MPMRTETPPTNQPPHGPTVFDQCIKPRPVEITRRQYTDGEVSPRRLCRLCSTTYLVFATN